MADVGKPPAVLPAARKRLESTTTVERAAKRKAGFLTFLLATLVAAGLLALIGWQAAPWLLQNQKQAQNAETPAAKAPAPAPLQPPVAQTAPAPSGPADLADAKPSPMPPAPSGPAVVPAEPAPTPPVPEPPVKSAAKAEPEIRKPAPPRPREEPPVRRTPVRASAQPVTIISSPGGATAELDGRSDTACSTPCSIDASPGRHTLALTLPGYQIERREVDVGSSPMELPAIVLHAPGGTLMLTSTPSGATVLVDGKRIPQTTPAQIPLSLGSHRVTVQKDGREGTQMVEMRAGIMTLRITLEQ